MQPSLVSHRKNQCVVFKKTIAHYFVHVNGEVIICGASPRLRKELIYPTADPHSLPHIVMGERKIDIVDPVAVGDEVSFVDNQDGTGLIIEIKPRKSMLTRRAAVPMPSAHGWEQIIVANVDQVVPVISAAQPKPHWNLLDRYLVSAESLEILSLICITKMDLVNENQELDDELALYHKIGYPTIKTSTITGLGLDEIKTALKGRISVFIGQSGVGKTSLLNAIQPGLGLRVKEVNKHNGKGRHTTSHLEMFPLEVGGGVVDTPGMREFGLWEVDDIDLAYLFPEIRPFIGKCKFGLDCSHTHEPGCSVVKAVKDGTISERRYYSYLKLQEDG